MITKEQHQREINKIKRNYDNILIDIMFAMIDIEDIMENSAFPLEEIDKKIEEIKKNIGKSLS